MQQQPIYPRDAYPQPASCNWFYLGAQASGDVDNKILAKAPAIKHPSFADASLWANAGWATVGGGATNYCTHDVVTANLGSLAANSVIVTCTIKKGAVSYPAAENQLYASYKAGSENGGAILASMTTGNLRLYLNATDGTTVSLTTAANVISDGTNVKTATVVFIVPRNGTTGYWSINGLEAGSGTIAGIAGKSLAGGWDGRWGAAKSGGAIDTHRMASFQGATPAADITAEMRLAIYDWVQRNPHLALPDWMFGL